MGLGPEARLYGPRPLVRAGPPWVAEEVRAAVMHLTGDPEPSARALLAAGELGVRLEALRREADRAGEGVPRTFGPIRRTRLLAWDSASAVWEGWNSQTGDRLLLRVLRPAARGDATVHALLDAGDGTRRSDGAERLESAPFLASLGDMLPLEEPPDAPWRARVLLGVVDSLARLDGTPHGLVHPDLVVRTAEGWRLAWLGPAWPPPRREEDDLRDVGEIALALGDPAVGGFAEEPPWSATDARRMVVQALAEELVSARHQVVRRSRHHARSSRASRLRQLVDRLEATLPPPEAFACIRAGRDGVNHLLHSDGRVVRGGVVAGTSPDHLPSLYEAGRLDAAAARALVRAWRGRLTGDDDRRGEIQAELGTTDAPVRLLIRWIGARLRLRADRLLLDATLDGAT